MQIEYKPRIKIENIVSTVSLNTILDFYSIERSVPEIEYDPEQFPGLIFRLEKPKITALIFKAGKMVITGAKNINDVVEATKIIIKTLEKYGTEIKEKPRIQIQNIVASANLNVIINLDKTSFLLKNTMYEPEQFPGLIYRLKEPKTVILIFSSGKLVITGARREEEIPIAVKNTFDALVEKECVRPIEKENEEI